MSLTKRISVQDVADTIDHSLLKPDITVQQLIEGCSLARQYRCVSVCIRPSDLLVAAELLKNTSVAVTTVVGFPHGTCTLETKVFETEDAVSKGAVEVDMVMNVGRFLSGEYDYVKEEIARVAEAAHKGNVLLKVIFENFYLTDEQIIKACELAGAAGADFIKTSTGYAGGGATVSDIQLMSLHAGSMKVKAAGGIRTLDDCLAMMSAGAVRCGTRSTETILREAELRAQRDELFLELR